MSQPPQPPPPPAAPLYPTPPPPPPRPRPPTVVVAAVVIMFVGAAVGLANSVISVVVANQVVRDFRSRASGTSATQEQIDAVAGLVRRSFVGGAVVVLLLAVVVLILAVLLLRASNAARITTWVFLGLSLCCGGCGALGAVLRNGLTTFSATSGADQNTAEQLSQALRDSLPAWINYTNAGLSGAQVLGYLSVIILLALPSANAFFHYRRQQQLNPAQLPPETPPMSGPSPAR